MSRTHSYPPAYLLSAFVFFAVTFVFRLLKFFFLAEHVLRFRAARLSLACPMLQVQHPDSYPRMVSMNKRSDMGSMTSTEHAVACDALRAQIRSIYHLFTMLSDAYFYRPSPFLP